MASETKSKPVEPDAMTGAKNEPQATAESAAAASATPAVVPPLPDFSGMLEEAAAGSIDLLKDVELNVKIELGRAEMTIEQILRLTSGSVVELDKLAGDPVDILVNEQLIARGEVLVVNDNFCVRINEILPGATGKLAQR
jgi:flagellar motor switch protein FliN/FliY